MDLAKIRQKARQGQTTKVQNTEVPVLREQETAPSLPEVVTHTDHQDITYDDLFAEPTEMPAVFAPKVNQQAHRKTPFNPLEVLLAGRKAAGCDEDLQISSAEQADTVAEKYEEFLCIRVSNEIYGINIMQIKEIIRPREVTEIPRAPSFVYGVISLRGVIIPIVDMLDRLGLAREKVTGRERVVVVKHGEEFTGLLVDEVIQVVRIAKESFEPAPSVLEGINRDFVCGIGRADHRMIIMLNLDTITDINLY